MGASIVFFGREFHILGIVTENALSHVLTRNACQGSGTEKGSPLKILKLEEYLWKDTLSQITCTQDTVCINGHNQHLETTGSQ